MSDDKLSAERNETGKNYEETLTDDDVQSEEIYQMEESKENDLESDKSETDERYLIENPELLKIIDSQKKGYDYAPVDTDIDMD